MKKTILDIFFKNNSKVKENTCNLCGRKIPDHIAICWYCGQLHDEQLIRLTKIKDPN
jgi:hypothetical protein